MHSESSDLVVVATPVLGVEPGHVAEARRALAAQGRSPDDDAVVRLLWAARALPAALDALTHAHEAPGVTLDPARIELLDMPAARTPLVAVAWVEHGAVVVDILAVKALLAAEADDASPCCTVTIPFHRGTDDGVALHRFTLGPQG